MGDQQFCLRWNNHQNTLISVFDTLLEGEILVDCTLAAEGKFLRAHKVVLSACSPFFSDLLRQHYEQHPILIMKDVRFDQLKSMLNYMYRGEVNISQDQLGTFLKAAESLQIKGLSDSSPSNNLQAKQKLPNDCRVTQLPTKQSEDLSVSRSNNASPTPRRKKRRRPSGSGDDAAHEENTCEQIDICTIPSRIPISSRLSNPPSPPTVQTDENKASSEDVVPQLPTRLQPTSNTVFNKSDSFHQNPHLGEHNILYEPKSEFIESNDDDDEGMPQDEDVAEAGPSHSKSDAGGFSWQMDQTDESFLHQESLGGQRSAQDTWYPSLPSHQEVAPPLYGPYSCPRCARKYAVLYTLERHLRYECGVDKQFACPVCHRRFSRRDVLRTHQKNSKHYTEIEESSKLFMDMGALSTGQRKS